MAPEDLNTDKQHLLEALREAARGRGSTAPNPAVGAVFVVDGRIVARGFHRGPGQAHAEVAALDSVTPELGARGTLYVTLEPCNHFGRTPPCSDLVLAKRVARVVYGHGDRNAGVAGGGAKRLGDAGVQVDYLPLPEVASFYESYDGWLADRRARVTAKIAVSLDGKYANAKGGPIPITGPEAKQWTFHWRRYCDAVLTTATTILADDPRLDVRLDERKPEPRPLYVLDREGRIAPTARVFSHAKAVTVFVAPEALEATRKKLSQTNARVIAVACGTVGLDIDAVLAQAGADGFHDLWLEAGARTLRRFLSEDRLAQLVLYLGCRWIGVGLAAFPEETHDFLGPFSHVRWVPLGRDVAGVFHRSPVAFGPAPLT